MKKTLLITALFFSGILFAQEANISITPKKFKNTIVLKTDLLEKTNLTIEVLFNGVIVDEFRLSKSAKKSSKINLSDLDFGNTYDVRIYNSEKEIVFVDKITKSLKY